MTTLWKLNRDEVITAALRKLAVLSGGTAPQTYQKTDATQALNAMIKGFQTDGMPVWAMKSHTFNVIETQGQYVIGEGQALNTPAPLKVTQAWRTQGTETANIPMNVYTDFNYNLLPLAISSGTPVNLYYQPFGATGNINLWPLPSDSSVTITIRYQRPFTDMVAPTDDFDFPSYWTEALIYGLADRLAPEYGLPLSDRAALKADAKEFREQALSFGTEEGGLFFQPDWSGRRS